MVERLVFHLQYFVAGNTFQQCAFIITFFKQKQQIICPEYYILFGTFYALGTAVIYAYTKIASGTAFTVSGRYFYHRIVKCTIVARSIFFYIGYPQYQVENTCYTNTSPMLFATNLHLLQLTFCPPTGI